MKIGIVGTGMVGATTAYALVMRGIGREIVLVDQNQSRELAEVDDLSHAVPFAHALRVRGGETADLAGCRVIVLSAGANQRPGETRLELLERNAAVFRSIVPPILEAAPEAVLVVATNPVDVLTHLTADIARRRGVSPGRVLGSGTTLDTARFRSLVGRRVDVDAEHIHGYVVGEHGDSEVLAWSSARVGATPLDEYCEAVGHSLSEEARADIDRQVRGAAQSIIAGKGSTYYGVGSALARIVEAVLHDHRAILTVCAPAVEVAGVPDVTLALPRVVGANGVLREVPLRLDAAESAALQRSAAILRKANESLGL